MKKPKAILFDLDDTLISFEGVSDEAWEKCCTEFTRKHALNLSTGELLKKLLVCLFPNTIETLTKLRAEGYRLGLITNGSSKGQRAKLERFGLHSFFEIILIDQEVGFGKPDRRAAQIHGYIYGMARLQKGRAAGQSICCP